MLEYLQYQEQQGYRRGSAGASRRPNRRPVKVLIADDNIQYRRSLARLLEATPEVQVVGEASDGEEAVVMARRLAPDAVLLDLRMPKMGGVHAAETILRERASVVVFILTAHAHDLLPERMERLHIRGILRKDQPFEEILRALHDASV